MVLTAEDSNGLQLSSPPIQSCNGAALDCEVYHDLNLGQVCGEEPGSWIDEASSAVSGIYLDMKSAVFYSASAFTSPEGWLEHAETEANAKVISEAHTCDGASGLPDMGKGLGSFLKAGPVNDNLVLRLGRGGEANTIDTCWAGAQESNSNVLMTYFGSATGLFRLMPASLIPKKYDATRRTWYMAAVANRWENGDAAGYGVVMTTPYLDAFGQGEVVTIAKAVTRGGEEATNPVAGVVGVDVKLSSLAGIVEQMGICGKSNTVCMLLDETAHVIFHPDFVSAEADEKVFLATIHREAADALISQSKLTQNTCIDYSDGRKKSSYSLSSESVSGGSLSCGNWALSKVSWGSGGGGQGQRASAASEAACSSWSETLENTGFSRAHRNKPSAAEKAKCSGKCRAQRIRGVSGVSPIILCYQNYKNICTNDNFTKMGAGR